MGPKIVVITSTHFDSDKDFINLYASQLKEGATSINLEDVIKVAVPVLGKDTDPVFTGTGDLLSSMLLAHNDKFPDDLGSAVEHAVNILHQTLEKTIAEPMLGTREVNLIASKDCIENPVLNIKCQRLLA